MLLKRSFLNCKNCSVENKCNPWVIEHLKETKPAQEVSSTDIRALVKAKEICDSCANFELK